MIIDEKYLNQVLKDTESLPVYLDYNHGWKKGQLHLLKKLKRRLDRKPKE